MSMKQENANFSKTCSGSRLAVGLYPTSQRMDFFAAHALAELSR
jgi:hypothetical protein